MSASYLQTLQPFLPEECLSELAISCQNVSTESMLETLIRFAVGGQPPAHLSSQTHQTWLSKQVESRKALDALNPLSAHKRARNDEDPAETQTDAKRQKVHDTLSLADDPPIFCLHAISATSPIRKKVDITVHKSSIKFTHPASHTIETTIPLASLQRAFLVPTRGKQKPHWTVILLSSDTPERGKQPKDSNPQIIFGLDATTSSAMATTVYPPDSEPQKTTIARGADVLPSLRQFLRHTNLPPFEPTPDVFRSACPGNLNASARNDGIPGVEAYRAAKLGTLWFMRQGILWGEGKPCEFWAVEDMLGKESGLRTISATGRTCSVILTRKETQAAEGGAGSREEEEDPGIETEFAMVDGKERDGINQWVRQFRNTFGKKPMSSTQAAQASGSGVIGASTGAATTVATAQLDEESDASDESFEDNDSDDGGSVTSKSSDDGSGAGSGDKSAEGEESDASGEEDDGEEDEDNLRPENHPLMRPGAMPKMSRATIDAVVGMVNDDLMGEESEGEDELDE